MGKTKALPGLESKHLLNSKTPWIAALVILTVALALLPLGQIDLVASISAVATLTVFIAVNLAMIYLHFTKPSLHPPFRVAFAICKVPILPVPAIQFSMIFLTQFNLLVNVITGTLLAARGLIFFWRSR